MRRFVVGLFALLGLTTAVLIVGIGVAAWRLSGSRPSLPDTLVLTVDFGKGLGQGPKTDTLSALAFGSSPTLRDFLDALDRAGGDPRVKGIYARIGGDSMALATCQEVRDAIAAFRAKGKFAIAFSESFGEFGPGTRPYYLATGFDEIWLQPLGTVGLIGLQSEMPFFRSVLDKIGVEPAFAHREEYKTAMNNLTESAMTPPQREELGSLLSAASGQIVRGIATARKLPEERVTTLIDSGPFVSAEAKRDGLVDRVGYRDQALARARERAGSGAELVSVSRYLDGVGHPNDSGPTIALIYANGLITAGGDDNSALGNREVTARQLGRAFRAAARDSDVRAILLRINSPGGSATASETIWREVEQARERGKPVIVSMGDVAGSGGYYIAAPADKIVAEPATLTGSIGVLAGKIVIAGLLQKLDIHTEAVQRGANAAMFSAFQPFSPAARQRLDVFLDDIYAGFKQRVADGRHLSADQVEAVAKGRVWTGEEAKAKGLVDELGGYDVALRLAREAAKIGADQSIKLSVFPREKNLLEKLYERLHRNERPGVSMLASSDISDGVVGRLLASVGLPAGGLSVLRMPPIGDIR